MARHVQADHEPADDSGGGAGAALVLWDCGSTLYDSYELTAFKRQLDAAVLACRSLSMPHLPAADPAVQPAGRRKRARRLPALLRRLFSKVLRLASARGARHDRYRAYEGYGHGGYSGTGSPWSGALTSIPEESGGSPEAGSSPVVPGPSALRRAQSERFIGSKTATPMVQFDVVL
ncbi:hypothetical protein CFC21_098579 [Triticum aestivum]|uniref:Uncharacterized protein n=3 Tax=Triticum TaxID=4564 RepID=A0A3B6RLQ4_WHEAT|nr:uncharacterized protein LOC119331539 [Triticum dicoccoides]XP_044427537.1 uncharacterized protein LOC123151987 [Triticum aestivum]XP_048542490.1 uncharacterized protein LOC125521483 [Triticum urartu]KAF7096674.1 hypothetical protein CFC21_098579 [Triticum aestivum]